MNVLYSYTTNIIPGYRTDQSGVTLELTLNENERGRGYWKLNKSLSKYHNYIQIGKDTISDVKQTYAGNNSDNSLDNQQSEHSIDDQRFIETPLLMIRGITIKYSSFKKKQQQVIQLEQEIKIIEDEVNANFINMSDEILDKLEAKKTILYCKKIKLKVRRCFQEVDMKILGENPTHTFLI